jgi:protein gp37
MHWWDGPGWNPISGCRPTTAGCRNCYAATLIATQQTAHEIPIHLGTTDWINEKPVFNGTLKILPPGHPLWDYPLQWPGARDPVMGPGKPSLLWCCNLSDLFIDERPSSDIDRVVGTVTASKHIGLLLTKYTRRMHDYFLALPPRTIEDYRRKLWLGFSAERQQEFDHRWEDMQDLAAAGFTTFVSIAPMLTPVVLPPDLLALGDRAWVICSGEVRAPDARYMEPDWARAVRDQCARAAVPFFVLQMSRKAPIPADLRIWRRFPRVLEGASP